MADFLLELLSEEIPARMQAKAASDLAQLFAAAIARSGLVAERTETFVTPRRLALIARGLPPTTQPVAQEAKGPRADAPAPAIAGFLGKTGLAREQLVERADAKGNLILFAVTQTPGRPAADVLADAVPAVVRGFPWPKAMRWGAASAAADSLRWVRPLQGIVALLEDVVVPIEIAGIVSGRETMGHRFLHAGAVPIAHADSYAETLRAAHVIVDADERRRIVRDGAGAAARAAGLALVEDEGLVAENGGLTEWPVPLLGHFDPAFLAVPREVIQLTMRTNQKYFACVSADGALAPAFVCTANIAACDGGAAIVSGNAKVLAARLADARFFWEQDRKTPLAVHAEKLDGIVFHEKLGTVADKVARVASLARWLVGQGVVGGGPALAELAEQAARLCKADLVTGMVGEFPELQGVMGGYYAAAEGLDPQVAAAIRDHYKPVGQGDEVPTTPVTVAVSLADKLDTLVAFFAIGDPPTGSKDPFAIRRAVLGAIRTLITHDLRVSFRRIVGEALDQLSLHAVKATLPINAHYLASEWYAAKQVGHPYLLDNTGQPFRDNPNGVGRQYFSDELGMIMKWIIQFQGNTEQLISDVFGFATDRLKIQQREAGVRHDLIDAVFALGDEDDLVRLLARVKALQAFVETDEGANLLAGYRRAANILRAEAKKDGAVPPLFGAFSYPPDPAEQALAAALDRHLPDAERAIAGERFADAMTALSVVRPAIDRFFDAVTVNADDPERRTTRLALLAKLVAAVHKVADFSKIEG